MIKNTLLILTFGVLGTLAGINYGGHIKDIAAKQIKRILK